MARIEFKKSELVLCETWWQKQGLSQTASGFGAKMLTRWKVKHNGRLKRIYCAIWSNSGTCYIIHKGEKIIVDIDNTV